VHCAVTYHAGPFQGQGTIWNLSYTGWRLSGDLPMRPGETLSMTVTLPNTQGIEIPEAEVRWSRGAGGLHPPHPLNHQLSPITESSIRIRIHATAHTPGVVSEGLTVVAQAATEEAHDPRVRRKVGICRR